MEKKRLLLKSMRKKESTEKKVNMENTVKVKSTKNMRSIIMILRNKM